MPHPAAEAAARATAAAEQSAAAERAAVERAAAEQLAQARVAADKRLAQQATRNATALGKARDDAAEWRDRAGTFEQQLYEERRQPDSRARSANAATLAARAEAEREAKRLEAENQRLARGGKRWGAALERERTERKAAEAQLMEAEERRVNELRQRDAEQRSSNSELAAAAAAACATVEQLAAQLARAKGLKRVQEAERLEAELEAARAKLARTNSLVTSLRRSQSAAEVTRLKERAHASDAHTKEAREEAQRHAAHAELLQEEAEKAA
eukprot:3280628-Prymnesium_polylepis.1